MCWCGVGVVLVDCVDGVARRRSVLQCNAVCCSVSCVLQCVAMCCSVLLCVVVSVLC